MGLLGLRERLEPVGDLVEALVAGGLGHARVHVGVLVGLAGDRGLEVVGGTADGQARGRITDRLEVLQMAVGVAGLALGGGTEHGGDVIVALDIGLIGEVKITAIRLRLACERVLEILFGLAAFEHHHVTPKFMWRKVAVTARRPPRNEFRLGLKFT